MSSVFDDLIDQEAVIATLKDAVAASKDAANNTQVMTHSWLFTGPPGSGRSNAAIVERVTTLPLLKKNLKS